MEEPIEVVGIDWSGARDAGRRAWVCHAGGSSTELRVTDLHRVSDRGGRAVEDLLAYVDSIIITPTGARWVGFDFPFSVTRGVAEHLGQSSWRALLSSWESLFPDAVAFAKSCTAVSLAVSASKEAKRCTDKAAGAPMSPWNLRLFRQTYHGVRLLARLANRQRVAVLPWNRPDDGEVRVVEICPAATLTIAGRRSQGYKGRRSSHASKRKELVKLVRSEWDVSISREVADVVVDDRGGDALDAVLAAVSTYHHAARLSASQHANVRALADLLEGHIYARSDYASVRLA